MIMIAIHPKTWEWAIISETRSFESLHWDYLAYAFAGANGQKVSMQLKSVWFGGLGRSITSWCSEEF